MCERGFLCHILSHIIDKNKNPITRGMRRDLWDFYIAFLARIAVAGSYRDRFI